MAYSFNGNNAYMDFSIGNLTGVDGGPFSVAAVVNLGDAANGAIAHIINAAASAGVVFLETFGTLNYGVNTIARTVSSGNLSGLGVIGNWAVLGGSKADVSAAPEGHYGVLGAALTHFTASSSLTDVGAGSASDATFKIRLGRFLASTSEYVNGSYAVAAIWKRVLSTAEWNSLATGGYAAWQATNPDWMVIFTNIGTVSDVVGTGHETARSGSPAISLVADPPGFFGGGGPSPVTDADSFTLDDTTLKINATDTETFTLGDGTFRIGASSNETFTLTDNASKIGASSSEAFAFNDGAASVGVSSTDTFAFSDGTVSITVRDAELFTLVEGAVKAALATTESFTLDDSAARAGVSSSDSFAMTDNVLKIGVSDSDTALLSEAEHGRVTASDSFTFDDTVVRIALTADDSFTLASELGRLGVSSTDAFAVSDAVFAGKGSVVSGDTFALIESEQVGGLPPAEDVPSVAITIKLSSPALTIKLGTPNVVISLSTPRMELER